MNDTSLFIMLRTLLLDGLSAQGFTGIEVKQKYQPTTQGAPSSPAIFLFKVGDRNYGTLQRRARWDSAASRFRQEEGQQIETTLQCSARSLLDPEDFTQLTASDIVNLASGIIQSEFAITRLSSQNVGIYKVEAIRAPFEVNDFDNFDMSPSFDFTVTHKRTLTWAVPHIDSVESGIHRV